MSFTRMLDESYPHVYEKWQQGGETWIIQDLPPEDQDEAIRVLTEHLCTDEVLCNITKLADNPESVRGMCDVWHHYLATNMSLGCYIKKDGMKRLVALNVCYVLCGGESIDIEIVGDQWKSVYDAMGYCDNKFNVYDYLGEDKLLKGLGLVVSRKYRGSKLGARILAARDPLCRLTGIKGASTVFTSVAAQKSAARCGYTTVLEVSLKELAEIGLKYPKDDPRSIYLMVKKID